MTKPHNSNTNLEDQFADYTDRILNDQSIEQDLATFAPESELHALEQTALRLKYSFGNNDPDEVAIQRMRKNIIGQWQQEKQQVGDPFWKKWIQALKPTDQKWQSRQSRQRFSVALSIAALVILVLVSLPLMNTTISDQPAASGQNPNSLALIVFGGLLLLALWLFRRKP